MTFQNMIGQYITLSNAMEYDTKTDKWLWIVDNILDPAGFATTNARVNWIEDRFDTLLGKDN